MDTNLIKWEVRTQTERETIGTLLQVSKGADINFIPQNFEAVPDLKGKIVNLMLVMKDGDTSASITCSPNVSKLVRAREITKAQLAGFPVCQVVSKDGEIFAQVQMPNGAGLVSVGAFTNVEEYVVKAVSKEELIDF